MFRNVEGKVHELDQRVSHIEVGIGIVSMGGQQQAAHFANQVGEVKAYAQNHLERLQGAVDLATKQREDDGRYFSQLFESLRMELGLVKAENAALKMAWQSSARYWILVVLFLWHQ